METKIKKINKLEELKSLVPGDKVLSFEYGKKGDAGEIVTYEGVIEGKYAFMQQLGKEENFPITSWRNNADNLFIDEKLSVLAADYDIYSPEMKCFQSKLNLIKGTK